MKKANDLDTNYLFEVRTKKTTFIFNVSEIVYLESNGCYTLLKLQNKSILVSKTLKYFEDKSYEDISEILRTTVSNVGAMINRAKSKLKEIYEK